MTLLAKHAILLFLCATVNKKAKIQSIKAEKLAEEAAAEDEQKKTPLLRLTAPSTLIALVD